MKTNIFFLGITLTCFVSCTSTPKQPDGTDMTKTDTAKKLPVENPYKNSKIEAKVFNNDSVKIDQPKDPKEIVPDYHGYGYKIFIDDNLYVIQPHVPGVSGLNGFKSRAQAQKAGDFVCYKIRNNIMPPTVTPSELDSLGVLK